MKVGSLFSGIGGLDLGLERAGMRVAWQCESDPYCRAVLRKHWPDVPCYPDVRELTAAEPVDLICGGFPCQPVSRAGKKLAQADDRWLWPHFTRIVRVLRPRYVLVENVPGLLTHGVGDVLGDLASLGFDAEWESLPAAAVGAPHLRDRIFVVAWSEHGRPMADAGSGRRSPDDVQAGRDAPGRGRTAVADPEVFTERPRLCSSPAPEVGRRRSRDCGCSVDALGDTEGQPAGHEPGHEGQVEGWLSEPRGRHCADRGFWAAEPDVGRVANGVPSGVDRLRCLGNAVVPQVAEWVGRQIMTHASVSTTPASPTEASS